jgi:hypothetical protein
MAQQPEYIDNVDDFILSTEFVNKIEANYIDIERLLRSDTISNYNPENNLQFNKDNIPTVIIHTTGVLIGITSGNGNLELRGNLLMHGASTNVFSLGTTDNILRSVIGTTTTTTYQPITTPGDLVTFSSVANTQVRVPIGSTGQVLTPDPSSPTGFVWQNLGTLVAGISSTSEEYFSERNERFSTNSRVYLDYITLTTPSISGGTFVFNYFYNDTSTKGSIQLLIDGIPIDITGTFSGFSKVTLLGGVHTFSIQIKSTNCLKSAIITRAGIHLIRVT